MDLFDKAMQHGEAIATSNYLSKRVEELTTQLAERDQEITRLRADGERLDWLEGERGREKGPLESDYERSLYRRNMPITRQAIDAARGEGES